MSLALRRTLAGVFTGLMLVAGTTAVHAQNRGGRDSDTAADEDKKKDEWEERDLRLREIKAEGPCPYVKVLYDAARYHEFKDDKESTANAMWTGEINGVTADCAYKGADPIHVGVNVGFSLGRGPMADGETKVYHYWIAVTEKDAVVLAKQEFDLPVTFRAGEERIDISQTIEDIVIPRADIQVSGSNFEVLVGFDVTPQMVAFNREGKHFRYVTQAESKPQQ
ncbi:MAG: Tat pathway signal sequence domain protein [Asticcacaulis sp.]|nr:Tat pathway signal sequence domain protein [Asticcacaulis sp.]